MEVIKLAFSLWIPIKKKKETQHKNDEWHFSACIVKTCEKYIMDST